MSVDLGVRGPLLMGLVAIALLVPAPVHAQTKVEQPARLDARLGTAMFLKSQSLAGQHLFKPSASLALLFPLDPSFWLGAGASGIVTANLDYQAAGGYVLGRAAIVRTTHFEWGLGAGLGVGSNPPILYSDLKSEAPLAPFLSLSTDASWSLGDRFRLGLAIANEQLSVMHLGAFSSYTL